MPQLDAAHGAILVLAALLGGAVNSVAGGGSLITFPALLYAGYAPVTANITNSVSLLPGYLGGTIGYRTELRTQGDRLARLVPVSVAGALVGAALLVAGPAGVFGRVVPWLILGSCALLLAQPRLKAWVAGRSPHAPGGEGGVLLLAAQGLSAAYGAYFGAGLGVIMLALLGIFLADDLQRINALKGALSLAVNLVAVLYFLIFGSIAWLAVALMAPASFLGGQLGVALARRLEERPLRLGVVVFGVCVAIRLLV